MQRTGFDNARYLETQSAHIRERIEKFGGKLYLEFGGKLFDDHHAARVLPGFNPDSKVNMLAQLQHDVEIVIVVNADDIEKNKIRGDLGITYDLDVLRLIDAFRDKGLFVGSVVLTRFADQPSAILFQERLRELGVRSYRHFTIDGYPSDIDHILSPQGYGRNDFIETTHSLVVVTAPGPGSGKMATCLSQLYHEHIRGTRAGFAKFETFPIWNLPLKHPVNLAYEAATADLHDVTMLDPFHLEAYGERTVNYNRDVEIFPVLDAMFRRIWDTSPYKSPTDMGVNMAGSCIHDDKVVSEAANQEIIRRYYAARCAKKQGLTLGNGEIDKLKLVMSKAGISEADRPVVAAALTKERETGLPAVALQLPNGQIITGRTNELMGPSASVLLNALKACARIDDSHKLISSEVIVPIQDLKVNHLGNHNPRLHTDEILLALSICAVTDPVAELAMEHMFDLKGCEAHASVILSQVDMRVFKSLGVNITCEPKYQFHRLYHK